jgi:hypothetical protein
VPESAKNLAELLAIRKALQSEMLDEDGNLISLWDYAINREVEVLSAETGFARDTDEDPDDVRQALFRCTQHVPLLRAPALFTPGSHVRMKVLSYADYPKQTWLDAAGKCTKDAAESQRGGQP